MLAESETPPRYSEYNIGNDVKHNGLDVDTHNIDESIQKSKDGEASLSPYACLGDSTPTFKKGESSNHIGAYQSLEAHKYAVAPNEIAVWQLKGSSTLLCAFGATVLMNEGLINGDDLMLYDVIANFPLMLLTVPQLLRTRVHQQTWTNRSIVRWHNRAPWLGGWCHEKCREYPNRCHEDYEKSTEMPIDGSSARGQQQHAN